MNVRIVTRRNAADRDQLVDAAVDSYVAWREQCETVLEAYEIWTNALGSERPPAFAVYQAALDEEEIAAGKYESAIEAVRLSLQPDREAPSCT